MARIRTLKPEIVDDEALGRCSRDARLLFVLLITQADDEGRLRAAPALLRGRLYPYDEDVTAALLEGWLAELAEAGVIRRYDVERQCYADLPSWRAHQRINRPSTSSLPGFDHPGATIPSQFREDSVRLHGKVTEPSRSVHGGVTAGKEGKGKDSLRARAHARPEPKTVDNSSRPPTTAHPAAAAAPPPADVVAMAVVAAYKATHHDPVTQAPMEPPRAVLAGWVGKARAEMRTKPEATVMAAVRLGLSRPRVGWGLLPALIAEVESRPQGAPAAPVMPSLADRQAEQARWDAAEQAAQAFLVGEPVETTGWDDDQCWRVVEQIRHRAGTEASQRFAAMLSAPRVAHGG